MNGQHLNEINGLNHYIGMKPIQAADFMEMRWMPFVFGLIILLTLRSVVFGEMSNVVDLFALYTYFGVFSIGSFWYRLYEYGHNLDPHAPVHIKPFTPMLIGVKQIANFREASYPMVGAYLLCLSVLLIVLAGWFSRKEPADERFPDSCGHPLLNAQHAEPRRCRNASMRLRLTRRFASRPVFTRNQSKLTSRLRLSATPARRFVATESAKW